MTGTQDPPVSPPDEPAPVGEPGFESDRQAIKKDILDEETLEKELQELERQADELQKARARLNASRQRQDKA